MLPAITLQPGQDQRQRAAAREIFHIRDSSLYTPRDFDVSPYFDIVKPTLAQGFDYRRIHWAAGDE